MICIRAFYTMSAISSHVCQSTHTHRDRSHKIYEPSLFRSNVCHLYQSSISVYSETLNYCWYIRWNYNRIVNVIRSLSLWNCMDACSVNKVQAQLPRRKKKYIYSAREHAYFILVILCYALSNNLEMQSLYDTDWENIVKCLFMLYRMWFFHISGLLET